MFRTLPNILIRFRNSESNSPWHLINFPCFELSTHYGNEVDLDFPDIAPNFEGQKRFIRDHMEGGLYAEKPAIGESCLKTVIMFHYS